MCIGLNLEPARQTEAPSFSVARFPFPGVQPKQSSTLFANCISDAILGLTCGRRLPAKGISHWSIAITRIEAAPETTAANGQGTSALA
jgi:hypothetical protein